MTKAIFFDFDGVLTTDATGTTSIVNYIRNTTDIDAEAFEKTQKTPRKEIKFAEKLKKEYLKNKKI